MIKMTFVALLSLAAAGAAHAATTCSFVTSGTEMTLQGDCTTDTTIIVPNGMTLDGAGYRITALDPPGGNFHGAIIRSGGTAAQVVNTVLATGNLANVCAGGDDSLTGILFDGASGTISGNTILSLNKNSSAGARSSCQEGNAIKAVNFGPISGRIPVAISGNTIRDYQKTGIIVSGEVDGTVTGNTVVGAGPQADIGQNGIQIGEGATGRVRNNTVSGNAYTGGGTASGGIIVASGPLHGSRYSEGIEIDNNTLVGNDVGVWLMQMEQDRESPAVPTRAKVMGNSISNDAVTNKLYQAGITDHGNGDEISGNHIAGTGYDPATRPGSTFSVDRYNN